MRCYKLLTFLFEIHSENIIKSISIKLFYWPVTYFAVQLIPYMWTMRLLITHVYAVRIWFLDIYISHYPVLFKSTVNATKYPCHYVSSSIGFCSLSIFCSINYLLKLPYLQRLLSHLWPWPWTYDFWSI